MLVTMTGYLTNTISTCQGFTASSVTNLRRSCNSVASKSSEIFFFGSELFLNIFIEQKHDFRKGFLQEIVN